MSYLVKQFAFFSIGIVNKITLMIVEKILTIILESIELLVFFQYTDFRVSEQGRAFTKAAFHNVKTQKEGTDEEKRISEENLKAAFREFARINR